MKLLQKIFSAAILTFAVAIAPSTGLAKNTKDGAIGTVAQVDLPKEAQQTLALIQKGGPFPYKHKDGTTFGNREGVLPRQSRGYYSEYTVKTPGSRDRGARRIIAGKGKTGEPATSGEYYYTDDHYASFKRILVKP